MSRAEDRPMTGRKYLLAAGALAVFMVNDMALAADTPAAKSEQAAPISVPAIEMAPSLSLVVNRSTILRLDNPAARISVANPAVADITPISPREIYVLGKAIGNTNLIVWNKSGAAIMMDVKVTPEPVMATPAPVPPERNSVEVIKGLNKSQMEF